MNLTVCPSVPGCLQLLLFRSQQQLHVWLLAVSSAVHVRQYVSCVQLVSPSCLRDGVQCCLQGRPTWARHAVLAYARSSPFASQSLINCLYMPFCFAGRSQGVPDAVHGHCFFACCIFFN
jgi:hypothetical protein